MILIMYHSQINFSENLNYNLQTYLELPQSYERVKISEDIRKELNVITFSNPGIGLSLMYWEDQQEFLFNNHGVKQEFTLQIKPLLIEGYNINTFGPHISMERYKDKYVLSTIRKLDSINSNHLYFYLESNLDLTKDLLEVDNVLDDASYLILDKDNRIIYNENSSFKQGDIFTKNKQGFGRQNGYYWFEEPTRRGWDIIALIPIAQYDQEINQWIILMLYITILFVCISLVMAFLLWKTFYRPLNDFQHEIKLMENSNFHSEVVETNIPEFKNLINQFRSMRKQIVQLIKEIEVKEKIRADLEVEKLMHQINPHFLMNTLDTARWLSVSGEKAELTNLLTWLNKILYYNMGKLGTLSTLNEELEAMEQYLKLQKIRYDFEYSTTINVKEGVLQSPVPRFILQPLVENAIYHGLGDEGEIRVIINLVNKLIVY